jgi:hypothetical protein
MGWLMQPRRVFLWYVPAYLYRWGFSKAYLDILYSDDIVTQYDTENSSENNGEEKAKRTMEKWYAMHPEKRPKKSVNLDELMGQQSEE